MPSLPRLPSLPRPGRAKRAVLDPAERELADTLPGRMAAARVAEDAVREAETQGATVHGMRALRTTLDRALNDAVEAADAAYRVALGPVEGMKRIKLLNRLQRPAVKQADDVRREIALARSHHRVATRDQLGVVRIGGVPPSVGTGATTLATKHGH